MHILFKIQLGCEIKEKNTLSPNKWAFVELPVSGSWVACSSWAAQGKLLPYEVALHQDSPSTGAATCSTGRRQSNEAAESMKLNWSNGLFSENESYVSSQCVLHTFTPYLQEAIAGELPGTKKLARPLSTSTCTEPPTPITETAAQPRAIPALPVLQPCISSSFLLAAFASQGQTQFARKLWEKLPRKRH